MARTGAFRPSRLSLTEVRKGGSAAGPEGIPARGDGRPTDRLYTACGERLSTNSRPRPVDTAPRKEYFAEPRARATAARVASVPLRISTSGRRHTRRPPFA